MLKINRTRLLLGGKIILAGCLLGWVLSGVHWHDYAILRGSGKAGSVLGISRDDKNTDLLTVRLGMLWWARTETLSRDEFESIPGTQDVVRLGFASSLRGLRWGLLGCAVAAYLFSSAALVGRWWILLRTVHIKIGLMQTFRLTFLGMFFNSVAPGTIGGDLVKAYYVARQTHRKAAALLSIFIDRILGLAGMGMVAAIMLLVVLQADLAKPGELHLLTGLTAAALGLAIGILVVVLWGRAQRVLPLERLLGKFAFSRHLVAVRQAAGLYRLRWGRLLIALGITAVTQTAWISSIWLAGLSIRLPIPWYNYFLYIPLIYIAGAVPLTPGGVGLIEKLYLVFFVSAGMMVTPSMALALALLARLIPIFSSLPGAIFLFAGPPMPHIRQMQQELEQPDQTAEVLVEAANLQHSAGKT